MRYYLSLLLLPMLVQAQDTIQEVKVQTSSRSLKKSLIKVTNTQVMTSKELLKAACCNLAESFETNPSIDVNYSDALTGTRQIKMLGLTSPYLLITEENIPSVRGASQAYGLSFTPGSWVESIQVTKGAGSVVNGFESISGQINAELIKPLSDIPFYFNFYGSTDARFEVNSHFNKKVNDFWSSSLFVHGNARLVRNDMNHDHFLDNPLGEQVNVMNRWQYQNAEKGYVGFITARFMTDRKMSGDYHFDPDRDRLTANHWGSEIKTDRFDFATKVGYVFPDMPFQSIGFQNAFTLHNQDSYFGFNQYDIRQASYYSNLVFNSIIGNTMHKFATGASFMIDAYDEWVYAPLMDDRFDRIDNSVGAFFEYTYDNTDNFSLVAGVRADMSNRLGFFLTPRLHMRYNPWAKGVLRASVGRGKRAANIFAENQQLFASSRQFNILDASGKVYGLDPEIAWNYGVSFSQGFNLFGKAADAGFDLYRTDFSNQAVADLYAGPDRVNFYNLKGDSFATSLQVDFNLEIIRHLNLRTAYKLYDLQTDYDSGRFERPMQSRHRFFANLEYATHISDGGKQWRFDATYNWMGEQRLPSTAGNPDKDSLPEYGNPFSVVNAQVTRTFSSVFEVYAGAENLFDYQQSKPILGSDNPFGPTFDASIVYAPVFGRMLYAGLRYKIK